MNATDKNKILSGLVATGLFCNIVGVSTPSAYAEDWSELAKPLVKEVLIPGLTKGMKIWSDNRKKKQQQDAPPAISGWDVPPESPENSEILPSWDETPSTSSWADTSATGIEVPPIDVPPPPPVSAM